MVCIPSCVNCLLHYSLCLFLSTESCQLEEEVKNNCVITTSYVSSQGKLELFSLLEVSHNQSILIYHFTHANMFTQNLPGPRKKALSLFLSFSTIHFPTRQTLIPSSCQDCPLRHPGPNLIIFFECSLFH